VDAALRSDFTVDADNTLDIVTESALPLPAAASYSRQLSLLPGVDQVTGPAGTWAHGVQVPDPLAGRFPSPGASFLAASIAPDPLSGAAQSLVRQVRAVAIGLSKISMIQMFGLGTAVAIVLDATLIRGVIVPAFMRLAGNANWWAPAPLRALHRRIGLADPNPGANTPDRYRGRDMTVVDSGIAIDPFAQLRVLTRPRAHPFRRVAARVGRVACVVHIGSSPNALHLAAARSAASKPGDGLPD